MMTVYRIAKAAFIHDLTGEGARLYGGRWNRPGVAALYTSQARSLCMLELIVHFNAAAALQLEYNFISFVLDPTIVFELPKAMLPDNIGHVNNEELWALTDTLFADGHLAIKVPSVIIPKEFNVIINPKHAAFKDIQVGLMEGATIDNRLFK